MPHIMHIMHIAHYDSCELRSKHRIYTGILCCTHTHTLPLLHDSRVSSVFRHQLSTRRGTTVIVPEILVFACAHGTNGWCAGGLPGSSYISAQPIPVNFASTHPGSDRQWAQHIAAHVPTRSAFSAWYIYANPNTS